jgi:hypothetical protein
MSQMATWVHRVLRNPAKQLGRCIPRGLISDNQSASSRIAMASSSNQGAAAMELGLSQLLALLEIASNEMTAVSTKPLALTNLAFIVCSSGARMASRAPSFSQRSAVLVRCLLTRKGTCPQLLPSCLGSALNFSREGSALTCNLLEGTIPIQAPIQEPLHSSVRHSFSCLGVVPALVGRVVSGTYDPTKRP